MLKKLDNNGSIERTELNLASKIIILIYFFSGACSLIYEVIWVRLLKLTIGNTVYSASIGVSVFMGGLAIGSFIMSNYADTIKKRLRLYAILEILATISALMFPVLLKLMDGAYRWFYISFDPSNSLLLFVQIIVSAILLLIPAMIMGSTLPLIGRFVTSVQGKIGSLVGKLYAINTLGATIGCFLAGFVLIQQVGVMGATYIAAAINLLIAISSWFLSNKFDTTPEPVSETHIDTNESQNEISEKYGIKFSNLLLLIVFSSGFISVSYELIWMRSIVFLLGSPTYVFSAVLTIYLLGNVIGALVGSVVSKRVTNPLVVFGISISCLGILGIFYLNWFDLWQKDILPNVMASTMQLWKSPTSRAMLFPMLSSFFLYFIPSFVMGFGFPLSLQAWGKYNNQVGKSTGLVYSINTIGAVLGGLIVGFVFIPLLGVQKSIMVLGLYGLWLGTIAFIFFIKKMKPVVRLAFVLPAIAVTIIYLYIPVDLFIRQFVTIARQNTKLLSVKEGINTTASVHQSESGELILATSGIKVAGDHPGFRITQKTLGHLGLLLNKNAQRALTVGFGTGETSCCLSKHKGERVDVIEIAPEMVETSLK